MARKLSLENMLMMVVSLIFISFILPIGLVYIANIGDIVVVFNGANTTLASTGLDTVITLLTVLVPISIAIGIVLYYIRTAT